MNQHLLPYRFKKIGWMLLLPATVVGIVLLITDFEGLAIPGKAFALWTDEVFGVRKFFTLLDTNLTPTIVGVFFIVGAMFVCLSKEKVEDEYITKLRLNALLWAIVVNYSLLLICFIFIYGTPFLNIMVYNMFTILILFILRFNYVLVKSLKQNEK